MVTRGSRIIPACAGSTRCCRCCGSGGGDHPRMRGEHSACSRRTTAPTGSSPHARGAPEALGDDEQIAGIIPACAGSTTASTWESRRRWDHPRMRGEHRLFKGATISVKGSSPHARGAQVAGFHRHDERGIIPACAGSTTACTSGARTARDHPRMRGEHWSPHSTSSGARGSSPHARGTTSRWSSSPPRRDHPRMRGEHPRIDGMMVT